MSNLDDVGLTAPKGHSCKGLPPPWLKQSAHKELDRNSSHLSESTKYATMWLVSGLQHHGQ